MEQEITTKKKEMESKKPRLHFFFSKTLKKLHANPSKNSSSSPSLLSACMHPRTPSFASGRRRGHVAAANDKDDGDGGSLADNFRSLHLGATVVGDDGDGCQSDDVEVGGGGVAVVMLSRVPYEDFRRSMQEMVGARRGVAAGEPAVDWDFMEELLFCYLQLNDRVVHKDILRAFTDTVAALRRQRRRAQTPARSRRTRRPRAGEDGEEEKAVAVTSP